jgi:FLVCR family MFS transporter 7
MNYTSPPFKTCMKLLFKNKNFIKLLIIFTCVLGYFNLYGTIVNEYLMSYGFSNDQTTIVGGTSQFCGITGTVLVSIFIDKFKKYKLIFLILNIIGLICHVAMTMLIELFTEYGFIIVMFLWSIATISIIPIYACSFDFVIELTYPIGESISGGLIMSCSQISGIVAVR